MPWGNPGEIRQQRFSMTDITKATPSATEIIKREECFKGFYQLDRVHLRHELFAGGMSREISREVFVRHDAVCVLPYDPQRDVTVRQVAERLGKSEQAVRDMLNKLVKIEIMTCRDVTMRGRRIKVYRRT